MYSPVSKYSPEARKRMTYRSNRGKSCGYYMRIVFFFSSLIQSLIIVSLVLFLVYGQQQDSASVARVQDLELRFSQLSMETVSLRQQRKNLTHLLNVTVMEKARNEYDLRQLRFAANISYLLLDDNEKKLQMCIFEKNSRRVNCPPENRAPLIHPPFGCNCGMQMEMLSRKMELVQSNFTQTAMQMQMEMDQIARDRDNLNLEVIQLRRDKSVHEKAIQFYQIKCKEEFVNSLSGISNVSKAFLGKIDSLFHALSPFHLTCPKQKEYLEQIRVNCTDLSEEVVTKFQSYLDRLGNRVSMYQGNISVLTAENMRLTRDYNLCSQNRTGLIREHKQHVARIQLRYDEEKETLLKEKKRLGGDLLVLQSSIKLKDSQIDHMGEQLRLLNLSCIPRTGFPRLGSQPSWGPQPGSSNPGLSSLPGQFNRNFGSSSSSSSSSLGSSFGSTNTNTGLGSSNTGFNKPSSGGLGSSSSLGSNTGFGSSSLNKFGSSNQGSSLSSFGSSASGTGLNKQPSSGFGSSSSSSSFGSFNNPSSSSSSQNKFGSSGGTGASLSNLGSNYGSSSSSLGSNLGSSSSNLGSSSNSGFGSSSLSKTTSNSRGSSNSLFGSSSSSSGSSLGSSSSSQNKLSSSSSKGSSSSSSGSSSSSSSSGSSATTSKGGFGSWGWLGGGSSSSSSSSNSNSNSNNSDQSKLGSNQGRGSSNGGTGFGSFGSGRTNSFSFTGPISVNQHLRDLQRIINPQAPEEKQELSRMMG